MIKFEFTLEDAEAELVFDVLREQVDRIQTDAEHHYTDKDEREWLHAHAKFLESVIEKMLANQKRVNE